MRKRTRNAEVDSATASYVAMLSDLRERIRTAQVKAALAVNRELISLYWHIGRSIIERQRADGWGRSVVARLSRDLAVEFPSVRGFSPQNLWQMRAFYLAWTEQAQILQQAVGELDGQNLPQPVGEIPWGHNLQLLAKLQDPALRLWYAKQTVAHGWSRAVLTHQIETGLHERQGRAVTNYSTALLPPKSDLVQELIKDPYDLDFLLLSPDASERDLENALIEHLRKFLLELGVGFAFIGNQVRLDVGGKDYYIDLLFYHLRLHCYVALDLKLDEFKPEYAGKMSFYLTALDDQKRGADDEPSIGLILCKSRNRVVVEYALRNSRNPIGVAEYRTTNRLPKGLQNELPAARDLIHAIRPRATTSSRAKSRRRAKQRTRPRLRKRSDKRRR